MAGEQIIATLQAFRSNAIKFLEPQYQKIHKAANDLIEFVKEHKKHGELLDPAGLSSQSSRDKQDEALILLQNYRKSFERELTQTTELKFLKQVQNPRGSDIAKGNGTGLTNSISLYLDREVPLQSCIYAYENQDEEGFVKHFRSAVDDMDSQYIQMRNARK